MWGDVTSSKSHGGFNNDVITMNAMLQLVLAEKPTRRFTMQDLSGY